jgi:hypothetical protein
MGEHSGPLGRNSRKWAQVGVCGGWGLGVGGGGGVWWDGVWWGGWGVGCSGVGVGWWWGGLACGGVCGGVGVVGCCRVCGGVVCEWCGGGGLSFALEHSKVCTLCDFGHLQF